MVRAGKIQSVYVFGEEFAADGLSLPTPATVLFTEHRLMPPSCLGKPFLMDPLNSRIRYDMSSEGNEGILETMRVVLGAETSDMEMSRALHLVKNDVAVVINIMFDAPSLQIREKFNVKRTTVGNRARVSSADRNPNGGMAHSDVRGLENKVPLSSQNVQGSLSLKQASEGVKHNLKRLEPKESY